MNVELKPCPFCGGEARVRCLGVNLAIASCTECSCVQQVFSCPTADAFMSEEDCLRGAAELWNRRVEHEQSKAD